MVIDRSPALDRVFHALAHPARRAILRRLSRREQNLSELAAPLKMSFPAAAKHVRVLERARLVRRRKSGRSQFCRLAPAPLRQVAEWTEGYREHWERSFAQLDALLEQMKLDETQSAEQEAPEGRPGAVGPPAHPRRRPLHSEKDCT